MEDNTPLTDKEKLFVLYYTESLNKSESYRKAFPEDKSKSSVVGKADKLLAKPKIKKEVNEIIQKTIDADLMRSPAILLKQIERYLEFDICDYYYDDGRVKPSAEIPVEKRLLINNINKQVLQKNGGVVLTYELPPKIKVLDKLESLVSLVAKVRAASADTADTSSDVAKKRDEIFNSVIGDDDDGSKMKNVTEKKKRGKGRPRSVFRLHELPEDIRKLVAEKMENSEEDVDEDNEE